VHYVPDGLVKHHSVPDCSRLFQMFQSIPEHIEKLPLYFFFLGGPGGGVSTRYRVACVVFPTWPFRLCRFTCWNKKHRKTIITSLLLWHSRTRAGKNVGRVYTWRQKRDFSPTTTYDLQYVGELFLRNWPKLDRPKRI